MDSSDKLYEKTILTDEKSPRWVSKTELAKELGFSKELTMKIRDYLINEKLIQFKEMGNDAIEITHYGICEIEQARSNPDMPTDHFPSINFISIGKMKNSQIQQASPQAIQQVTISMQKQEELKDIIESLKESIDKLVLVPQLASDLQAEIKTIEAQMSYSKPKSSIINSCLQSIQRILEGVASNIIAFNLLSRISGYLGNL